MESSSGRGSFFVHRKPKLPKLPKLSPLMLAMVALASCVPKQGPPAPLPTPVAEPAPVAEAKPPTAVALGVTAGPTLPALSEAEAARALEAFRISCPALVKRTDSSGLTRPEDWREACAAAAAAPTASAFFAEHFELVRVGDGVAFVTGYFEPEIAGSRIRRPGYEVPIYRKPADLVEVDAATALAAGTPRRGRLVDGIVQPYFERSEIESGALDGQGLELAWAADAIDLFFLEIQGSGRLRLPDGGVMRIGYAGQNGRDYVGIGKLMKDRGLLAPGQTTMQGIVAWLRAHPEEGRAIMRENKSYVFFQELTGPGPLGALGLPVTARATVATDPKYVPMGAPVLLQLDRAEASGLWVAQDTGGAIRGSNRFDTFWGAGPEAARVAGGMQGRGRAFVLVPKGILARLDAPSQP
ncbi:MAG: rane-bound lytic murein transglycosylase [Sphingomonadales bacterium]|jgi:membrane-bound lytic murein transglycosylase A|nr:rane-bound lytic murein transglycosylase [Sphingomonadales bacterium]